MFSCRDLVLIGIGVFCFMLKIVSYFFWGKIFKDGDMDRVIRKMIREVFKCMIVFLYLIMSLIVFWNEELYLEYSIWIKLDC